MIVTAICENEISQIYLPDKVKGQYWIQSINGREKIVGIEAVDEKWTVKSNNNYYIFGADGTTIKSAILSPISIIPLVGKSSKVIIYCEPKTNDRLRYDHYLVKNNTSLLIGRGDNCDISVNNTFVSSEHARLVYKDNEWYVEDLNSRNGVFVNNYKELKTKLDIGDVIFIMGVKIIVGRDFIAINNPDLSIKCNEKLIRFEPQKVEDSEEYDGKDREFFFRAPRFKRDYKIPEIQIDSPPPSPIGQELPWMLIMGSSMAMGMMSLVTLITAFISKNITSMIMGFSMLLGTVLLPFVSKKYESRQKKKKESLRQKKYREYLDEIVLRMNKECKNQEEILNENYISADKCLDIISNKKNILWERSSKHNDYLSLRLGIGSEKSNFKLKYSERKFILDEDNLQEELYNVCESDRFLKNVPIVLSFSKNKVVGIIGNRSNIMEYAKSLIAQMVAYYAYDELKMVFVYDDEIGNTMEYSRWLPHVWNEDKSFRFVAKTVEEVRKISSYFEKKESEEGNKQDNTHYVFLLFNHNLAGKCDFIKKIYMTEGETRYSIISFDEEFNHLPKECETVVEIMSRNEGRYFKKNETNYDDIRFVPEMINLVNLTNYCKQLLNTYLETVDSSNGLPKMLTFLEMHNVGKIEYLNPLTRWRENDPTKSLEAAVGKDSQGELIKLDLHEKNHGPHGLVAGMTGSGKSEFIITYILSMAVNYHPDEVSFVLIDYKGGGLAGAFVDDERGIKLPHIAGTITNLDGAAINRSLISIQSELRRRQGIFNEARKLHNEGTIDIYKYQKLYRQGKVPEAVPHLFIISDEFAELKTQQPEFMEQLVSAARIGRSLGVHLILATQKPNGVVDDQIWSNSRFRICLKVQEKADSMDMIKRPDAAALTDTGRFYIQVGFNEYFDIGQSAWCGAPYIPAETIKQNYDNSVRAIDNLGQSITEIKPKDKNVRGDEQKQLVALVGYLSKIAEEENIKVRALWLDPIPERIFIKDLEEKYNYHAEKHVLNPVIGEYDDPYNQKQKLMTLPLSASGNLLVYGSSGSGVDTLLETIVFSIISEHSVSETNIYAIDLGSETLGSFKNAPQIGDIMYSDDDEKVSNLFRMLTGEIEKRKKMFSEFGGSYQAYAEFNEKIPANLVVIINNFAAFSEIYESYDDNLISITRDSAKYGIYFIITASAANIVKYRLQQNFGQILVLQLNDVSDYVGILGQTDGVFPSRLHGRGLVKYDRVYEFQTALAADRMNLMEYYREFSNKLAEDCEESAIKIPVLPEEVNADYFSNYQYDLSSIPVGISKEELCVCNYDFRKIPVNMIIGRDMGRLGMFSTELAQLFVGIAEIDLRIFDYNNEIDDEAVEVVDNDYDDEIEELFGELLSRNKKYKGNNSDASVLSDDNEIVMMIVGLKDMMDSISEQSIDRINAMLEKNDTAYKFRIIVIEEEDNVKNFAIKTWYRKMAMRDGIWLGDGLYDKYLFKLNSSSYSRSEVDDDYGWLISDGNETFIKILG